MSPATTFQNKRQTNGIDHLIGTRIRARRLELGLSQTDLANSLKPRLTFQQIQKYEKGTNRVSGGKLDELATVLRVQPSFFFPKHEANGGDDPSNPDETVAFAALSTKAGVRIARALIGIKSQELQIALAELAEQLAARDARP